MDSERPQIRVEGPLPFSPRKPARLRHTLDRHPLLQLDALEQLARTLDPRKQCKFVQPGITQATPFHHEAHSHDGRTVSEVFARIESPGSWIALYNVEVEPAYRELLAELTSVFAPLVAPEQRDIHKVGGFVFISAPPSVTPFHIDRENNFWLQLRGRKTLSLWDPSDRKVVSGEDVEKFILTGSLEGVRLTPYAEEQRRDYVVGAGEGVYFPSTTPHATRTTDEWVRPGDGVSVSIGVVFYTNVTRKHSRVHRANQFLRRRFGFDPQPPGNAGWKDALKAPAGKLLLRLDRGFSRR